MLIVLFIFVFLSGFYYTTIFSHLIKTSSRRFLLIWFVMVLKFLLKILCFFYAIAISV